jgi:hypothetical protein
VRSFAAFALLAAGVLSACKTKTDEDVIGQILDETLAAANDRKAGGVVEHAAEAFQGPHGADLKECRRILIAYFLRNAWVRVFEQSRSIEVSGPTAAVKLDVVIAVGNPIERIEDLVPTNGTRLEFDVKLAKTDGVWRYTSADYRVVR